MSHLKDDWLRQNKTI